MTKLLCFVADVQRVGIYHRLASHRRTVMVEIAVPGERWEVEFFPDGSIEVEVFRSEGAMLAGDAATCALERLLVEHGEAR